MHRTVVAAAIVLAACGVDPEDDARPKTLEYVTEAILAPSCGNAQCHSSFRQTKNRAFDTIQRACEAMAPGMNDEGVLEVRDVIAGDANASFLMTVMTRTIRRMPYDQPLPLVDQELIRAWIDGGAIGLPATAEECK